MGLQLGTPTPFTQSQKRAPVADHLKNGSVNKITPIEDVKTVPVREKVVNGDEKLPKIATEVPKRKMSAVDPAYFIIKELRTTERTYKKDLEVINVWFRDEVNKEDAMPDELRKSIFDTISPIYEFHSQLVKDLDSRLAQWEIKSASKESQRIGNLFLQNLRMIPLYETYFEEHNTILNLWHRETIGGKNRKFDSLYRDFENQKVCYLPLTSFLLKPLHRLQHYLLLFTRLTEHFSKTSHPDLKDCLTVQDALEEIIHKIQPSIVKAENYVKLMELQRDLVGIDNLVQPGREFIREGCLQKLSRKGYQQRMFFLFNDVLLYTNRTTTPNLQFKVHGQLPLRGVMVEENESRMGATNCFTIYGGNRALMVSANNEGDKARWLEELTNAITLARSNPDDSFHYLSLKSISVSDEVLDKNENEEFSKSGEKGPQTRSNTTVHVCWHRATSVAAKDYILAVENQLSGYLLRKFKNSNGWQKLWVVFTNFCLFFYKTFQDDYPLASLPLLGYTISTPAEDDQIQKEFVFKLQFKNHVYFFRAESDFTFSRWMDVISSATRGSIRQNKIKE